MMVQPKTESPKTHQDQLKCLYYIHTTTSTAGLSCVIYTHCRCVPHNTSQLRLGHGGVQYIIQFNQNHCRNSILLRANSKGSSDIGLSGEAQDETDKAYDFETGARAGRTVIVPRLVLARFEVIDSPFRGHRHSPKTRKCCGKQYSLQSIFILQVYLIYNAVLTETYTEINTDLGEMSLGYHTHSLTILSWLIWQLMVDNSFWTVLVVHIRWQFVVVVTLWLLGMDMPVFQTELGEQHSLKICKCP